MTTSSVTTPSLGGRVLREGYGPGAWHGPDLKAAIADVPAAAAFSRPAPGRHNIAEIALHHAYYVRSVRTQLTGQPAGPFVVEGEDWFDVTGNGPLGWPAIQQTLATEYERLAAAVTAIEEGRQASPLGDPERFDLILGITCHAVYHAGQIQLIKKLAP